MRTLLKILFLGALIGIPLYPKFPLWDLEFTYLNVRLDDVYMMFLYGVFSLTLALRIYRLPRKLSLTFALFWFFVILSYVYNFFISKEIAIDFKSIGLLHALRRIEYMGIFFVGYALIESKTMRITTVLHVVVVTLLAVTCYGWGQRIWHIWGDFAQYLQSLEAPFVRAIGVLLTFPAVSTMNPEFARGHLLVLGPWARVTSTFAGHYDLAAYLVFILPIVVGFFLDKKMRFHALLGYFGSIFILTFTASRISFLVFAITMPMFFVISRKWLMFVATLAVVIFAWQSSSSMQQRFEESFKSKTVFIEKHTEKEIINQDITTNNLPSSSVFLSKSQPILLTQQDKKILQERLVKETVDEEKKSGRTITKEEALRMVQQRYKDFDSFVKTNVVAADISAGTRFQVEWPRALQAFHKNILLGTGPSSITESTDGDYLRWLGETGLIGFVLFVGLIGSTIWLPFSLPARKPRKLLFIAACYTMTCIVVYYLGVWVLQAIHLAKDIMWVKYLTIIFEAPVYITLVIALSGILLWVYIVSRTITHAAMQTQRYMTIGFACGTLALFLNASYIDVFEASKVAYTFWALAGVFVGYRTLSYRSHQKNLAHTYEKHIAAE